MAFIKEYFKLKHQYQSTLDYCLKTTNLGEKNESILRSICRQSGVTLKQWEALHNIAVLCAEIPNNDPRKILHKVKFDEPLSDETQTEIKSEGEPDNEVSDR